MSDKTRFLLLGEGWHLTKLVYSNVTLDPEQLRDEGTVRIPTSKKHMIFRSVRTAAKSARGYSAVIVQVEIVSKTADAIVANIKRVVGKAQEVQ
jgi:hypothetical protein